MYITKQCDNCKGRGWIYITNIPVCYQADFTGCLPSEPCPKCKGKGYITFQTEDKLESKGEANKK